MNATLDELIAKEHHRRVRLKRQQRPLYQWQEAKTMPPEKDVWCEYCVAYYAVPHTGLHPEDLVDGYCPNVSKALSGQAVCDCLDCTCAIKIGGEGSLASRITQA